MITIHAYIALTALGCIAFAMLAARDSRQDTPQVREARKAA
jgi:hypothetical protein